MGRKIDTFDLIPYQEDSFYWGLTYDETAKLARDPSLPAEFHVLNKRLTPQALPACGGSTSLACRSQVRCSQRSKKIYMKTWTSFN